MPTVAASPLRTYRFLAAALMGAVVVIGIALSFVVGSSRTDRNGNVVVTHSPGPWMYIAIFVLGVVMAGAVQIFGYRIPAISANLGPEETRATALRAYQQSMFLRFALSESIAIIAIALLFADGSNTILPYLLAAVIAELLMAYHIWPSENLISRVERRLDRNGGRSDLAAALSGAA